MTDTNQNAAAVEENLSHRELKLRDLREDRAKAQAKVDAFDAKIAALESAVDNEAAIAAIAPGTAVAYVYGRAASKRVLQGVVKVVGTNDKHVTQLKVEHGEGFDAEFHLIDSSALLLSADQIEKAQADIDAEAAEREAAAATKANEVQA